MNFESIPIETSTDENGKVYLPVKVRKKAGIDQATSLEILVSKDSILLKNTKRGADKNGRN